MMPFGMQGMQGGGGGGGWRGGMRGNGGYRGGGGGGMPNMQMQMRGAAAAAARGAPHPMMMRGPMGSGFPMMPPTPSGAMGGASPMQQQDERFRSTWLDASMCLPTLMGIPGPMMNSMMGGGGFGGAGRGGPRGGFSSPRGGRGTRGGYRGRPYNRDRESPRGGMPRHEGGAEEADAKEDERTPVDSPTEEVATTPEEQQQQE